MTTTTATDTLAYLRSKRGGFPLIDCGRCGATGFMPYSYSGGTCFACNGSRHVVPAGKPRTLWADANRMIDTAARADTSAHIDAETGTITCGVTAGDQVRDTYNMPAAQAANVAWRTVERVEIGDLNGCVSRIGCNADGSMKVRSLGLDVTIHYTDGTSQRGGHLMTRKPTPEIIARRDEMGAQARKAYDNTLAARARKARRATA